MKTATTRRRFIGSTSLAALSLPVLGVTYSPAIASESNSGKPAKLGGKPLCQGVFPGWPFYDDTERKALNATLESGNWFRGSGSAVAGFEAAYAKLTGAKHCLATASGTAALSTVFGGMDLGPGDEVIIPPYTFVATYNAVVLNYALPVFADIDLQSFQIDPPKMEAAITPQTRALLPVHIGGYPADMDSILEIGRKHKLPVIEDACQAHMAEWRGRKVGALGLAGCFSFQASKNLNSGEGGAVLTNDSEFSEVCYNFHNQGRARQTAGYNFTYSGTRGSNLRLCEFQGNLLQAQMTRLEKQSQIRHENGAYLNQMLKEVTGVEPARLYEGATRSAYHLYMFRYDRAAFSGLDRARFMEALGAEGIPCSGGYGQMNRDAYVKSLATNRHYLKIYGESFMRKWVERSHACPENEKLCSQAVWFTQNMLLAERSAMERIVEAIRRIQKHSAEITRS